MHMHARNHANQPALASRFDISMILETITAIQAPRRPSM